MAKKQKCPEFENHERWLVSYADMVTLLFAVFVVLYSLQMSGDPEEKELAGSMQESFNKPLEDIPLDRRVGPKEMGLGIFEHFRGDTVRPQLIQKYPSSKETVRVIDREMKKVRLELEERLYGPNKFRDRKKSGQSRVVSVQRTQKGFKLQLLGRHFFDSGETRIDREALPELEHVTSILKDLGRPVRVEGHTDSIPVSGSRSNWELSALRATSVLRYMIRDHGFPKTLISAAGYADQHPIADNGTAQGRRLNRRIELHVDYQSARAAKP